MPASLGWTAFLAATMATSLWAQPSRERIRGAWSLAVSVGNSSFGGASRTDRSATEVLQFFPYQATDWGVELGYGRERFRIALAAHYSEPGIGFRAADASELLIVAQGVYRRSALSGSWSARLLRLRGGPDLRPSLGLVLERWAAPGSPARRIAGGLAGLAVEAPLSRSLVAALTGEVGFTPGSPFRQEDLPEGFRQRSSWRRTIAGTLAWRF